MFMLSHYRPLPRHRSRRSRHRGSINPEQLRPCAQPATPILAQNVNVYPPAYLPEHFLPSAHPHTRPQPWLTSDFTADPMATQAGDVSCLTTDGTL